jgi:hypothetical protein
MLTGIYNIAKDAYCDVIEFNIAGPNDDAKRFYFHMDFGTWTEPLMRDWTLKVHGSLFQEATEIGQNLLDFVKHKFEGYLLLYKEKIIPDDMKTYGEEYQEILKRYMPMIEGALRTGSADALIALKDLAIEKFEIQNNAQYFAYNHMRAISILAAGILIAKNICSLDFGEVFEKILLPIYAICKDEEASCVRTNITKTFALLMGISPKKLIFFLDSRKRNPRVTNAEHGVINTIIKTYDGYLGLRLMRLADPEARDVVRSYAESKKEASVIESIQAFFIAVSIFNSSPLSP